MNTEVRRWRKIRVEEKHRQILHYLENIATDCGILTNGMEFDDETGFWVLHVLCTIKEYNVLYELKDMMVNKK